MKNRDEIHSELKKYPVKTTGSTFYIGDVDVTSVHEQIHFSGKMTTEIFMSMPRSIISMIRSVESSFKIAEKKWGTTRLTEEIVTLEGMSSVKMRVLLNTLLATSIYDPKDKDPRESLGQWGLDKNYLEIGCASGSTFISAMYKNDAVIKSSYVCDMFTKNKNDKFGKDIFLENCLTHLGSIPTLFDEDCFSLDLSKIKEKINVYFFDGPHGIEDHRKALTYFEDVFDDQVIVVIDDWNDHRVQVGTILGLKEIDYDIMWWHQGPAHEHWGSFTDFPHKRSGISFDKNPSFGDSERYWNGVMVFVLKKRNVENESA